MSGQVDAELLNGTDHAFHLSIAFGSQTGFQGFLTRIHIAQVVVVCRGGKARSLAIARGPTAASFSLRHNLTQ